MAQFGQLPDRAGNSALLTTGRKQGGERASNELSSMLSMTETPIRIGDRPSGRAEKSPDIPSGHRASLDSTNDET